MNIFERLQSNRLEDYCTDILVDILGKDENYDLLREFCFNEKLLKISEAKDDKSIIIKSQFCPIEPKDVQTKSRIDIQITGENFICFIEMKVESSQGKEATIGETGEKEEKSQLKKYHDCLINLKTSKKEYLRFCTKYNEKVSTEDIKVFKEFGNKVKNDFYFKDFRWYEIHDFLKKEKVNDSLIGEFLEFLELKNMSYLTGRIHYDEKVSFQFFEMLSNLKIVLERVKQENVEFDYISIVGTPQLRLDDHKRYGFSIPLGDRNKTKFPYSTNAFIGFDFGEIDKISQLIWFWSKDYDESKLKGWQFKIKGENRVNGEEVAGLRVQKEFKKDMPLQEIYDWFISELQNIDTN
ncbi:hypothetical protein [Emticicia agri]|uniref:PD-(D/E)XK nuclease family protein n=1 Tax=Emticicia agri TaxID=2492393 RepID=A0A4Q5M1U5_9BACT|nr:hypothetical protein [Emticicia agri]RYU96025.1 hypothetical protein EWM59_09000 [Emticicia agri]